MNILSCLLIAFLPSNCNSETQATDTIKTGLEVNAEISINSNGIASIPAFSLDKPAVIASISLSENRFSYDPALAYGLDFRPWFIDNWFRYKIIRRQTFDFRTGINFSSFFSGLKLPEREIHRSERYMVLELASFYKPGNTSVFSLMYWRDMGMDKGTIKGHFISLSGDKSGVRISNRLHLSAGLQVFYLNYYGNNDGFFVTPRASIALTESPFRLFFQATQVIQSNIEPSPGFRWNAGLAYSFL
jgi:hypothetical protein